MAIAYGRKGQDPHQVDVSRYGKDPWRRLSPFCQLPQPIPVPGLASYVDFDLGEHLPEWWASSVEGIWQGLKRIEGLTAPQLLRGQPRKRRGRPEGHDYGEYRLLDYSQAKALIYIPAYLEQIRLLPDLVEALQSEDTALVVDVSFQPDVLGPKPISHAALLVDILNGQLAPYENAHDELKNWAQQIAQGYESNENALDVLLRLADRASEIQVSGLLQDYESCSRLFLRENLMLSAVRCVGSHEELEFGEALLHRCLEAGWLDEEEARALSQRAPVCRWNENWAGLS